MKAIYLALLFLTFQTHANECAKEAKKFCSGIEPGKGQLAKCLDDYRAQLSQHCARELKDFKLKTGGKNACFEDLAEFCQDIPSDARRLEYCLLHHENRLGVTCSLDFKKKKGNLIVRDVCAQDISSLCYPSVAEPDGAINRCLIKNKSKLTGLCQKSVEKRVLEMRKENPCFDETEKFCPTQLSFVDIHQCMKNKINSLGDGCKKVVLLEVKKEKENPCYMDLRRHCKPGISPSEQYSCLALNEKEITKSCRDYRVIEAQKIKKMVELCEKDRLQFCSKVPFQNGMVLKCLKDNSLKISPSCRALL